MYSLYLVTRTHTDNQARYPSLIESSDLDGGSSVAVLTYLRCIIESITHPGLVNIVFQYLLATPEAEKEEIKPPRPTALARRRKSENLISNLAQGQDKPVPDLFNLLDLVLTSLRSSNQQTVTATLRLVCVLLRNRHQYGFSLIKTSVVEDGSASRSLETHDRVMAILFSFAEELADPDSLGQAYEDQLVDVQNALESHECSFQLLGLPNTALQEMKVVRLQTIEVGDPLLASLVALLKRFLASDIETNLALTQTISTLASCGSLRLDGWLVEASQSGLSRTDVPNASIGAPQVGNTTEQAADKDGINKIEPMHSMRTSKLPASENGIPDRNTSAVLAALDSLLAQVEIFRREVENFDIYLSEHKHVFKIGEDINNAVTSDYPLARRLEEDSILMPPPAKPRGAPQIGSIKERLLSTENSAQASRASSPRGRLPEIPAGTALAGRLDHLRVSRSPNPSRSDGRAFSPSPSPLSKTSMPSTPPKRVVTPMGPADALKQKVKVKTLVEGDSRHGRDFLGGSETSSIRSESTAPDQRDQSGYKELSLSHVLTNVIILQEFVLELAAIVQVRASLFGEVKFV